MNPPTSARHRSLVATLFRTLLLVAALVTMLGVPVTALPAGASVAYISNTTAGQGVAGSRTDPRSTITTIDLSALQQDQHWKGYVGNVSGSLSLSDAGGNAIYNWALTGAMMTGQVYATRNTSVNFVSVACAAPTTILAEDTFNNASSSLSDSINATFNGTAHKPFYVGATLMTNCSSIALNVNNTQQTLSTTSLYPEILIQDNATNLIYVSIISKGAYGFNGNVYDFQMIVGESAIKASPTSYYFFTELSG